jgi:Dullard-like phosphatase family protein
VKLSVGERTLGSSQSRESSSFHFSARSFSPFRSMAVNNTVTLPGVRPSRSCSVTVVSRPAIAFDLDETLIRALPINPRIGNFFQIKIRKRTVFIQMRPGLMTFLERIQKRYDVFFFTAAQPDYANQIIDKIAPFVSPGRRFARNACRSYAGYLVKDLRILRRPLRQTLLVDDMAGSALSNPGNLIRVKPWNGDPKDNLLLGNLLPFLEQISVYTDLVSSAQEKIAKVQNTALAGFPDFS